MSRNVRYVVRNKRRRRRRLRANQLFGTDPMKNIVAPVLGASAGFVAARYLGNMLAMRDMGTSDPKTGKLIAAGVGIPATFLLARRMGATSLIGRNSAPIVLGMGLAAVESYMRDTPLLGGGPAAAVVADNGARLVPEGLVPADAPPAEVAAATATAEASGDGLSAYYSYDMLGSLGDPSDQSQVEASMDAVEPVSTVTPTDTALRARSMPQVAPVTERFANRGGRAHAGGMFSRHLFSGMMGG